MPAGRFSNSSSKDLSPATNGTERSLMPKALDSKISPDASAGSFSATKAKPLLGFG